MSKKKLSLSEFGQGIIEGVRRSAELQREALAREDIERAEMEAFDSVFIKECEHYANWGNL